MSTPISKIPRFDDWSNSDEGFTLSKQAAEADVAQKRAAMEKVGATYERAKAPPRFDDWLTQQSGQTLPPTSKNKAKQFPSTPINPATAPSVPSPMQRALSRMPSAQQRQVRKAQRLPPPVTGKAEGLFHQLGQQRTIDQAQRTQEDQTREQVRREIRGRVGPYGNPTATGVLHLIANPVSSLTGLFKSEDEKVNEETADRIKQQQLAESPEVIDIRKEYGAMPAAARSVVAPLARGGAGLLHTAGGVASAFGIAPNRLSDWANKRAEIIESGAGNAPLRENRNLSSLITGQPELEEVQRGIPEKVVTGIADLGVGLGQIILLQKATKLPFNQLLALEAAARNNDKPIEKQLTAATEGYALGSALQSHLSKGANAALFGIPTAAQTGYEVSQGRMSPLDAAIQTGIQAGAGAVLTPKQESATSRLRDIAKTEAGRDTGPITEGAQLAYPRGLRERLASQGGEQLNKPQTKVQPPMEAQRETVEPATAGESVQGTSTRNLADTGTEAASVATKPTTSAGPQKFYHRDYGEVTEAPNQRKAGKGRIKVLDAEGREHFVKRSDLSGRGNQRMVPLKDRAEDVQSIDVESPQRSLVVTPAEEFARQKVGEMLGEPKALLKAAAEKPLPQAREPNFATEQAIGEIQARKRRVLEERAVQGDEAAKHRLLRDAIDEAEDLTAKDIDAGSRQTSARRSQFAEDRAVLDLPDLPEAERKSWQETLAKAKYRDLDKRAELMADEVLRQPRALNDEETAGLVIRAQELKNDHARVMKGISDASDSATIEKKVAERDAIESAFDKVTRAAKLSGTEKGRALASQKLTINQDYDLVSVLARAKAAKRSLLTDTERADYERLVARTTELEQRLAQTEQAASSKTLKREIDRYQRSYRRTTERKALDEEAIVIRERIAQAWAKVKSPSSTTQPSGLGRLDPLVEPILDYARNRVRAGVVDAADLVDAVHEAVKDVADVSKREIQQIISGFGLTPRSRNRTDAARELDRIRRELRATLKSELGPKQGPQLGPKQGPRQSEANKLPAEGPPSQESYRQRLEKRAAELEAQLASGNFTQSAPKVKPMPTAEVFHLQRRITEAKQQIEARLQAQGENGIQRLARRLRDALGLYRAIETSFDLSWSLRQGKPGLARHPILWSKAFLKQFQGLSNDRYFQAAKEIEADPDFHYLNKFGLETPSVDSVRVGSATHTRAEEFQTELAHKIPGLRQSEQVYNIGLDTLKTLWGKHDLQMLRKAGFSPDNPADFPVFKKAMQDINTFTGRTSLAELFPGKTGETLNRATPAINTLTYAVRFWASRLKILTSPLDPRNYPQLKATKRLYESFPRVQRVEAWKRLFAFYGLVGAQAIFMKQVLGFDIDLDPSSPDFLKLRKGKRVFDISAGTVNHIRLAARMAQRVYEAKTGAKQTNKTSAVDTLGQYLRTKESPVASRVHDIFLSQRTKEGYGSDFKGDPVYPFGKPGTGFAQRLKTARLVPKPLGLEDALEAYDQLGWGGVATSVPASVLGEGTQVYPKKKKKQKLIGGFK